MSLQKVLSVAGGVMGAGLLGAMVVSKIGLIAAIDVVEGVQDGKGVVGALVSTAKGCGEAVVHFGKIGYDGGASVGEALSNQLQ